MEVEHEQIWATGFFEAQGYASYHVDRKRGTLTYQLVIHNGDPQLLHEFAKTLGVPFGLKKVSRNSLRLTVNGSDAFGAAKVGPPAGLTLGTCPHAEYNGDGSKAPNR